MEDLLLDIKLMAASLMDLSLMTAFVLVIKLMTLQNEAEVLTQGRQYQFKL